MPRKSPSLFRASGSSPPRGMRSRLQARRLFVERLERRELLAGDGIVPSIAIRLEAADPVTLQPLTAIRPGDQFAVVAYARDLRPQGKGVFSAYFDLQYPANLIESTGPITQRGLFTNGIAGEVLEPGTIDEAGGFSERLQPPTTLGEQLVAAIPMRAKAIGVVELQTNAADSFGHDMLLYGDNGSIPTAAVKYGGLRFEVSNVSTELPRLDVLDDDFVIEANSVGNVLNVLANDVSALPQLTIQSISAPNIAGELAIGPNRLGLIYTPRADFSGVEVFGYTAVDTRGNSDSGVVTIYVRTTEAPTTLQSAVQLTLTDRRGNPLSSLSEGDEFILSATVEDLREDALGVFAAYIDVAYAANLARVTGPIVRPGTLSNGTSGNTNTPGLIDEAGGFQTILTPVGSGKHALFQVPMIATRPGIAVFQAGPSDELPEHQWLLFSDDRPIDAARISYGEVEVVIHANLTAVDDSYDLQASSTSYDLSVLSNDVSRLGAPLRITEVDLARASGSVRIAEDGRSLIYDRRPDFVGTEQFHYVVTNGLVSDVADVTVHIQPAADLNNAAVIRLEVTDRTGTPTSTINAGEEFEVRAFVKDLRSIIVGDAGVFAAYMDFLYDALSVSPVSSDSNPRGIDIEFSSDFQNGMSGQGHVPGVIDEVGAFQTGLDPLGSQEHLLFTARFRANAGRAVGDRFVTMEDTPFDLHVLANDSPNRGSIRFQSDPADRIPGHEFLLFHPPEPVPMDAIRYGSTEVQVNGDDVLVTSVSRSRHGGNVTIIDGGRKVHYIPPRDFSGIDEFTYSLGTGAEAVASIEVRNENDEPIAHADRYFAAMNRELIIDALRGVLANDQDADQDLIRAHLLSGPAHGRLELAANGSFSYVPEAGFSGQDSFTYEAFDAISTSFAATVQIEVASTPVHIRLQANSESGETVTSITAGEKLLVRAFVQDKRDGSRNDRGIGAAYLDMKYDATAVRPVVDPQNRLGFAVAFGPEYQNARFGNIATLGKIDNVGALQTKLTPLGRNETELLAIEFDSLAALAVRDEFQANKNTTSVLLDVLANDRGAVRQIGFSAEDSQNRPQTEIILYEPPQSVSGDEVSFTGTTVEIKNPQNLFLVSVESSTHGGTVTIDASQRVRYSPPSNFVGTDSFVYVVRDEQGRTARGTATIQIVDSWTNLALAYDTNGDAVVVPTDALVLINDLNLNGIRKLPAGRTGSTFVDVNRDGYATAQDVLLVINRLNQQAAGLAEAEFAEDASPVEATVTTSAHDAALGAFLLGAETQRDSTSKRTPRFRVRASSGEECDSLEKLLDDLAGQ